MTSSPSATPTSAQSASSSTGPSAAPSGSPTPTPTPDGRAGTALSTSADIGRRWLDLFRAQADLHAVLAVPYGDLDVASVLRGDFHKVYAQARRLSAKTMSVNKVASRPVVAPPDGFLPPAVLGDLNGRAPVLLSDRAFPKVDAPVVDEPGAPPVVLLDSGAADGGPAPTPPFDALALRQRILSEAALHALSPLHDRPLVVSTPQLWNPGSGWAAAHFFAGLQTSWLDPVGLAGVLPPATGEPAPPTRARPVYPAAKRKAELPPENALAARRLAGTGTVLARLLTGSGDVDEVVTKNALLAASFHARAHPGSSAERALVTRSRLRALLAKVTVAGPRFVTMTSEQGAVTVTLVNGLEERVTAGVKAISDSPELRLTSPGLVTLGPGQRASIRLTATSKNIGVHAVTLVPVNRDGRALGRPIAFNVRSSQVGLVIWFIMGAGAVVLFVTAGVRIARRVRERRSTHGPVLKRRSA